MVCDLVVQIAVRQGKAKICVASRKIISDAEDDLRWKCDEITPVSRLCQHTDHDSSCNVWVDDLNGAVEGGPGNCLRKSCGESCISEGARNDLFVRSWRV